MKFIATLKHTTQNCWAQDKNEEKAKSWIAGMDEKAAETGVEVYGAYVAPNEHTFYFILESDSFEGISDFLGPPLLTDHDATVSPVVSFAEAESAVRE